jgi:hypothetical protein
VTILVPCMSRAAGLGSSERPTSNIHHRMVSQTGVARGPRDAGEGKRQNSVEMGCHRPRSLCPANARLTGRELRGRWPYDRGWPMAVVSTRRGSRPNPRHRPRTFQVESRVYNEGERRANEPQSVRHPQRILGCLSFGNQLRTDKHSRVQLRSEPMVCAAAEGRAPHCTWRGKREGILECKREGFRRVSLE